MSYIRRHLTPAGNPSPSIAEYLRKEGLEERLDGVNRYFFYETGKIRLEVEDGWINVYVYGYEGETIAQKNFMFDNDDFGEFMYEYKNAVEWAADYV